MTFFLGMPDNFQIITRKFPWTSDISPVNIGNLLEVTRIFCWNNIFSPVNFVTRVRTRKYPWIDGNIQVITRKLPWNSEAFPGKIGNFKEISRKFPWNSESSPEKTGTQVIIWIFNRTAELTLERLVDFRL